MELQNIICAETLRELLTQARRAGWDHTVYSMGASEPCHKGKTDFHQHVWRRGQVQISFDLGRITLTTNPVRSGMFGGGCWSFPVENLDMDGLTLVLSVALTEMAGPGFQVPDKANSFDKSETWEEYADRAPWLPLTCPGGC